MGVRSNWRHFIENVPDYLLYFERPSCGCPKNGRYSLRFIQFKTGLVAIIFNSGRLAIGKKTALV